MNAFKLPTEPGPRREALVLKKTVLGDVFLDKVIDSKVQYEMLGPEGDLNGLSSPYTYVAKERTISICSPSIQLYKDILRQNNDTVIMDLSTAAKKKLVGLQNMVKVKHDAVKLTRPEGYNVQQEKKREADQIIANQFPTGD